MTALQVLVDENLAERAEQLGVIFREAIRAFDSPLVQEVRGRGLFNAIVLDESQSTRGRTAWQFCLLLKSRGVLAKPTHINMWVPSPSEQLYGTDFGLNIGKPRVRLAPPLVISEEDLMRAVTVIGSCLADLDNVRRNHSGCRVHLGSIDCQLDDVPGEVESERGHEEHISN
jgi:ornithine--oxo-acid transaminase